jgi:hypothetical protein
MTRPTKILKLFILLLLIVSCSNNERIAEFEKILGKEKSETLTSMVAEFENGFLKNKYPDLNSEQAYERLLTEMRDSKSQSWNKLPKFDKSRFDKSQLKHEIYSYVDSVWIETTEDPKIVMQYKYLDIETFRKRKSLISYRPQDEKNKDSIIRNFYTWTDLNYNGRFWVALKETCQKDKFIVNYLDNAKTFGPVQPEWMLDMFLDTNLNYSDYFIKRIIITWLSY